MTQTNPRGEAHNPELERQLKRLRESGMNLPRNPKRAVAKAQKMYDNFNTTNRSASRKTADKLSGFKGRTAGGRLPIRTSSTQLAMEKVRNPLDRFTASQIPYSIKEPEERQKVRDLCRIYYATHNLVPLAIDVYTRFPIQGMKITSKDPELAKFYEDLFFNQLNYEQFLIDVGREFFTVGEVNMFATFNESLGIFDSEQVLDPDLLTVTKSPFSEEMRYHLAISEDIKYIIEHREPKADYEFLVREYPEVVEAAKRDGQGIRDDSYLGKGLEISNVLLSRLINNVTPWDLYGTPHMLRIFTLLNLEEGLYAAQKAVADRLYSPFILAKLGSPDIGDGEAWVPDAEQLEDFADLATQAMAADFRFLVYNYGIEIESVFGRESVPRFDQDFDRLESKMLEVWGIGESLIQGGSSGPYASSALNSEFVTQLMASYQNNIKMHFKKRVEVIAEAQEHWDYDENNGQRSVIMEDYIAIEEDGEEHVERRPKLLLPELSFATMNVRDEETERQFYMELRGAGIPISDEALLSTTDFDMEEEIDKIQEEKIKKVVAQQELQVKLIKVLQERQLPLTPELAAMAQAPMTPPPPPITMPLTNDITTPINTPDIAIDPNAMQIAQQNFQMVQPQQQAAQMPAPPAPGGPPAPPAPGGNNLPQNQISQRPEISDNMRGSMPSRNSRTWRKAPSVVEARNNLSAESINDAIESRPWAQYLRKRRV